MITKSDIFYSYLADTLQEVQLPLISTSGYYNWNSMISEMKLIIVYFQSAAREHCFFPCTNWQVNKSLSYVL